MTGNRSESRPISLLAGMVAAGLGLVSIPYFLTPPAYLNLALRDAAFGSDLATRRLIVKDNTTGKTMITTIQRIGDAFVARIGRINSGSGAYTATLEGYKPALARVQAAALQNVRVPLDLAPTFGRLELTTVNAIRADEPVAATLKEGSRALTDEPQRSIVIDLPPGRHRISAQAAGFCDSDREFEIREGKVTRAAFPLSPKLLEDELARVVLGWQNEPRDLDGHLWKLPVTRFPGPTTVYFDNKNGVLPDGETFARLDVDQIYPGGYETLTIRKAAVGEYRYFIHAYRGTGTVGDARAVVEVFTEGCRVRTIVPPPPCAFRIWNVANFRNTNGALEVVQTQYCQPEGTTPIVK